MNHHLPMESSSFFRTELAGQSIPVSFEEIRPVLRDIVLYFELNLNEPLNIDMLAAEFELDYWKYLSICWRPPEYAESARYAWLCERGCLALLNGLSLDFLYEQLDYESDLWRRRKVMAHTALPYLKRYEPSESLLGQGREFLVRALEFIAQITPQDLDQDGNPKFELRSQGAWFTRNIVGDYFKSTAKLDFG